MDSQQLGLSLIILLCKFQSSYLFLSESILSTERLQNASEVLVDSQQITANKRSTEMLNKNCQILETVKLHYIADPTTKERIEVTYPLSEEQQIKLNLIASWDLSAVAKRAVERKVIAEDSVEVAENHYRVFLGLSYMYGNTPAFSPLGDDFWHTHLLFTWDYMQMCEQVFGVFLHHQPGFAENIEQNEAWRLMRNSRFKAMFGVDLTPYWNRTSQNRLWSMNFDANAPFSGENESMDCLFCYHFSEIQPLVGAALANTTIS